MLAPHVDDAQPKNASGAETSSSTTRTATADGTAASTPDDGAADADDVTWASTFSETVAATWRFDETLS